MLMLVSVVNLSNSEPGVMQGTKSGLIVGIVCPFDRIYLHFIYLVLASEICGHELIEDDPPAY